MNMQSETILVGEFKSLLLLWDLGIKLRFVMLVWQVFFTS